MSEKEIPKKRSSKIYLYVPYAWVEKAVEIGWEAPSELKPPPHNAYAVLMEWKRDEEPQMPFKSHSREVGDG